MSGVQTLISEISKLPNHDKEQIISYLEEDLTINSYATEITKEVAEKESSIFCTNSHRSYINFAQN
ncbi:MAG TPA: hypothetical protein DCM59_08410 [Clostridium sp.]|nr:hypothetical protein [Clostridium sp.]